MWGGVGAHIFDHRHFYEWFFSPRLSPRAADSTTSCRTRCTSAPRPQFVLVGICSRFVLFFFAMFPINLTKMTIYSRYQSLSFRIFYVEKIPLPMGLSYFVFREAGVAAVR